jgi:hypothetical protein
MSFARILTAILGSAAVCVSFAQAAAPPVEVPCGPSSRAFFQFVGRTPAPVGVMTDYRADESTDRDAKPVLAEPFADPADPAHGTESGGALVGTG